MAVSAQMARLMTSYGVTTRAALLRAVRDESIEETWTPGEREEVLDWETGEYRTRAVPKPTIRDAELALDGMLEATYQRIEGGAYDVLRDVEEAAPTPVQPSEFDADAAYERWLEDRGVE